MPKGKEILKFLAIQQETTQHLFPNDQVTPWLPPVLLVFLDSIIFHSISPLETNTGLKSTCHLFLSTYTSL